MESNSPLSEPLALPLIYQPIQCFECQATVLRGVMSVNLDDSATRPFITCSIQPVEGVLTAELLLRITI